MKLRKKGYTFLFFFCILGIAFGVAQAYAQAQKLKDPGRNPASLTQGPWMQEPKASGSAGPMSGSKAAVKSPGLIGALPAPTLQGSTQIPSGVQNPRSPASRARVTGVTQGGAQPSQVFPTAGAGNSW